jgi:hypothetical protein
MAVRPISYDHSLLQSKIDSDDEFFEECFRNSIMKNKKQVMQNIEMTLDKYQLVHLNKTFEEFSVCDQEIYDHITVRMLKMIPDYSGSDLIDAAKALDSPDGFPLELFDPLIEEIGKKCAIFDEEQLCTAARIFAEYGGVAALFKKLACAVCKKVENYSPKGISSISKYFSLANVSHKKFTNKIRKAAFSKIKEFSPSGLCILIHSWSVLNIPIPPDFFNQVYLLMSKNVRVKVRYLPMIARASAKQKYLHRKLFREIRDVLVEKANTLNSKDIALVVWSFSTLGYNRMDQMLDLFSSRMQGIAQFSKTEDLGVIAYSYARADYGDTNLFLAIRSAVAFKLTHGCHFASLDLYNIVTAFSHMGMANRRLFQKIAHKIEAQKEQFEDWQLIHIRECYDQSGYSHFLKQAIISGKYGNLVR